MALDVGKVRVGVALTDPLGYTAQPLLTLWRKSRGEDLRSLLRLIRKHDVTEIVVGNPLHMSGDVSPWAAKVYDDARASGKDHPHAIRVLSRAWIRVIWRCWLDGVPYDPARHGAAVALARQTTEQIAA